MRRTGKCARERLDPVVVAPCYVDDHLAMLLAAVHAGAHVYCVKPLVRTPAEADRVLAEAQSAGEQIAAAHIGRAFSVLPRLRAFVASGGVGRSRRAHGFGKCDQRGRPLQTVDNRIGVTGPTNHQAERFGPGVKRRELKTCALPLLPGTVSVVGGYCSLQ
jgi:hypothetical protein